MGGICCRVVGPSTQNKGFLMSEEVKEHKQGKPWKLEAVCDTYDEAFHLVQKITEMSARSENKKLETKIKRKANDKFVVKVRVKKDERKNDAGS
jgi:hypothetical protein